jgi:hypothetical protein
MPKVTLNDLANLNTPLSQINENFRLIEEAFENTVSRDGSTPNAMGANHDMNGSRILNVGAPSAAGDAARFGDIGVAVAASEQAAANALATAADRVQTGLDRVATGEDRVQTGLDRMAVASIEIMRVNTIDDLRASDITLNKSIQPLGYHTIGDGGGGPVRIGKVAPAGGLTDNGGSIIKPLGAVGDAIAEGALYWGWEWSGPINVQWFGAVGDGVADDTLSVSNTITEGSPLYWGGPDKVFHITSEIDEVITHQIIWTSDGATILYDSTSATQNCIKLKISPHAHSILGVLNIDANRKAFNAFYLLSEADTLGTYPLGYPELSITDLRVRNAYRSSTAFTGGNGILIEGGFNNVVFTRPHVVDCKMAAGSEVVGEQGIFGISVIRLGSSGLVTPHNIVVEDAFIDNITSEESTYQFDQDGMRLFTAYNAGGIFGTEYTYTVRGGVIKNCRNRGIKGQANLGRVNDVTFIRDAGVGGPSVGVTGEINEQIGSLSSSGCEFYYTDHVPLYLYFGRTRVEGYKQPSYTISNVRGVVTGSAVLESLFTFTSEVGAPALHEINITNVHFNGVATELYFGQASTVAPNATNVVNITNVVCYVNSKLVRLTGDGPVSFNLVNITNLGDSAAILFQDGTESADHHMSCVNVTGVVTTAPRYDPATGNTPNALRTAGLVPLSSDDACGIFRPVAFKLAQDEIFELPANSNAATTSGLMLITVSQAARASQAMFQLDQIGVYLITTSVSWSAGTTTEPGSGNFRMWIDPTSLRVKVSNRTATTRTFTVWMLG